MSGVPTSLAEISGAERTLNIGGKVYRAKKITLRMLGLLQDRVRTQMVVAAAAACSQLKYDPMAIRDIIRRVATSPIGMSEVFKELQTPSSACYLVWLACRDFDATLTEDAVLDLGIEQLEAMKNDLVALFPPTDPKADPSDPTASELIRSVMDST